MKRPRLIASAVIVVLVVSVGVGRWLNNDTVERGKVVSLLRAQARGDVTAMRDLVGCRDAACTRLLGANARRLRAAGQVKVALYESGTAHALRARTKQTRVVWFTRPSNTIVQCVLVRRSGNVLAGTSITLLRLSAPIGREAGCPS